MKIGWGGGEWESYKQGKHHFFFKVNSGFYRPELKKKKKKLGMLWVKQRVRTKVGQWVGNFKGSRIDR